MSVSVCSVAQSYLTLGDLMDDNPPGSSIHGIIPDYWSGLPFPSLGDLPDPGVETMYSCFILLPKQRPTSCPKGNISMVHALVGNDFFRINLG